MKPHGTYKLRYRHASRAGAFEAPVRQASAHALADADDLLSRLARSEERASRIVASLRNEILDGGCGANLRIRQVFRSPREIFRLELELPELGYQRTTLLDRDTLEELLEEDAVREVVETGTLGG